MRATDETRIGHHCPAMAQHKQIAGMRSAYHPVSKPIAALKDDNRADHHRIGSCQRCEQPSRCRPKR